ncbi:MAG: LEPR-XLL domain-containing protein [Tepidisphaeraceae bacterium]
MRKSLRRWFGSRLVNASRRTVPVAIEGMERRVLLSGSPLAPNWYGEFSVPNGTQPTDNYQVSALAPNGDVIVAFEANTADFPVTRTTDLIVAAFKSNGAGGLELDQNFGGFNDDATVCLTAGSGYSIINPGTLSPVSSGVVTPLGIAIDPGGNINLIWDTPSTYTGAECQLNANGTTLNGSDTLQENADEAYGIAVDPVANSGGTYEAYVAGTITANPNNPLADNISSPLGQPAVWAFNNGVLDSRYGGSGNPGLLYSLSPSGWDGAFTSVAANSNGIYLTAYVDQVSGISVSVYEIEPNGALNTSGFGTGGSAPITAPEGSAWQWGRQSAPFLTSPLLGIGLDSNGDVIIGGDMALGTNIGCALTRLTSTGATTTWGPNGNGQLWVTDAIPTSMAVNANGDILLNDSPQDTYEGGMGTATGTWISGSTGAQEALFYPYLYSVQPSNNPLPALATAFDSAGDPVLAAGYSPSSGIGTETLAIYGSSPDAPQLVSAASVQKNLNLNYYAIPLPLNVGFDRIPGVEDRTGQPIYEALDFGGPIALASNFSVSLKDISGNPDGTVGNSLMSGAQIDPSNPDQLDIPVSGWINGDTMVISVQGVENSGSAVTGIYTLKVGFLVGDVFDATFDVTGSGPPQGDVSGGSFTDFIINLGYATNSTNFESDLDGVDVIGATDFTTLVTNLGKSLNYDG